MQQTDRPVRVRVIGRPARKRRAFSRLPLWTLLAVLGVFVGVFVASARGGFILPEAERGDSLVAALDAPDTPQRQAAARPAEPTLLPAATAQAGPAPTAAVPATPEPAIVAESPSGPLPVSVLLPGLRHEYQGWNNCAPTSVGMVLSYYGRTEAQYEIAPFLKPDPNDKNVSPHEIAAYAQEIGFQAHVGVGGDLALLKRLLAAGFPVIVEFWFEPEPNDGMGHYRVLFGYDDQAGMFNAHDSYLGPNLTIPYTELDAAWRVFNRTYVVVYPPEDGAAAGSILDESTRGPRMWERALRIAREELAQNQNNAFAWFNLGASALRLGDTQQAAEAFDWARQLGLPWRMFWYQFGPFEAYWAQGRYHDVIALAEANLRDATAEEWHYWRGRAREQLGDLAGARSDYQAAIALNSNYDAAREALEASKAA